MMLAGWIESLMGLPQVQALGWTLVQFLWQGTVIAVVVAVVSAALQRHPRARYAVGALGLLAMLVTFLGTAVFSLRMLALSQEASRASWSAGALIDASVLWTTWMQQVLQNRISSATMQWAQAWCTVLWVLGVLLLQVRLVLQWRQVEILRRSAQEVADPPWAVFLGDLVQGLGLHRSIRILESAALRVPAVVGWLDPIVLVPSGILTHLTPDQLRAVLAHELAHLRRRDHLINLMQCVTESLLFFHPAVWWLSRQVRQDREYCCDDVALEVCGDSLGYARALHTLEELRAGEIDTSRDRFGARQAVLASTGGSLMDRITRLFGVQPGPKRSMGRWMVPGLLMVLLATALFAASCEPTVSHDPAAVDSSQIGAMEQSADDAILELQPEQARAHLEAAVHKLDRARESGDLSEEQYQIQREQLRQLAGSWVEGQTVVVPLKQGGALLVPEELLQHLEGRTPTKEAIHEYLRQQEEMSLHGAGENQDFWVSDDGEHLTREFLESHPDAELHFQELEPHTVVEQHQEKPDSR